MRDSIVPLHREIHSHLRAVPPHVINPDEKVLIRHRSHKVIYLEAIEQFFLLVVDILVRDVELLLRVLEGLHGYEHGEVDN